MPTSFHSRVYATSLFPLGHGWAQFNPDTSDEKGPLRIGSVAFESDGGLFPIFHIETPWEGRTTAEIGLDVPPFTFEEGSTKAGGMLQAGRSSLQDCAEVTKGYIRPGYVLSESMYEVNDPEQYVQSGDWPLEKTFRSDPSMQHYLFAPADHDAGALLYFPRFSSGATRTALPIGSPSRHAVLAHTRAQHRVWCEAIAKGPTIAFMPHGLFVILGVVRAEKWADVAWPGAMARRHLWDSEPFARLPESLKKSFSMRCEERGEVHMNSASHYWPCPWEGAEAKDKEHTETVLFVSYAKVKYRKDWMGRMCDKVKGDEGLDDTTKYFKRNLSSFSMVKTGVNACDSLTVCHSALVASLTRADRILAYLGSCRALA